MKFTRRQTVEVEIHVAPCIKCGSEDVRIYNCGYSSFDVGGGKCGRCENSVMESVWNPTEEQLAAIWNKKNDKNMVKAEIRKKIADLHRELKALG